MNSLLVNVDKIFQKVREDKINFHTAFEVCKILAYVCNKTILLLLLQIDNDVASMFSGLEPGKL